MDGGAGILLCLTLLACAAALFGWRRDRRGLCGERNRLAVEIAALRAAAAARDKAEAVSEAKSRLLATVSHELRTPLNGIIGMADLLRNTALSAEQRAYVTAMRVSGEALAALIDETLDFSRIEAGHLDLVEEPFDLPTLVEGVVELLGPRAQDKGLEIAALVDRSVPGTVLGDGARLRQVLMNLVGNAIKFTERGGVGVEVRLVGDRLRFSVADTGPGVPADRRDAIFAEFEQADPATMRRHGGTGLGLAISRRIVTEMGGALTYAPRPGGGALFEAVLPLPAVELPSESEAWPPLEGRTALVVSHLPFVADYLAAALASCGMAVERETSTTAAAGRLTHASRPDIVFVDSALGVEAARQVAATARQHGVGQVVMLLAPRDRHAAGRPVLMPGDGWLVKPVRARSLLERLQPLARSDVRDDGPPAPPPNAPHVLLAEDNPINALIARRALERLGARVTVTSDGIAALHAVLASIDGYGPGIDLVLMDIDMPGLDGLDVTRQVRAHETRLGRAPLRIVALTAHGLAGSLLACRRAGMDDVLGKPIAPETFAVLLGDTRPRASSAG